MVRLDDTVAKFTRSRLQLYFNGLAQNKNQLIEARKRFKKVLLRQYNYINRHYFSLWARQKEKVNIVKRRKKMMVV